MKAAAKLIEDDLNPFEPAPGQTHFKPKGMVCTKCDGDNVLVGGAEIYPGRADLFDKFFWLCRGCWLYVGCHPSVKQVDEDGRERWTGGGGRPLGDVADDALRALRTRAHQLFDPIWKEGGKTRADAYAWLAEKFGLDAREAHIAMLNEEQCRRLIDELCAAELKEPMPSIDAAAELRLAERFYRSVDGLRGFARQLTNAGLLFQVKNNGHHVIVYAGQEIFDAWPSTERWMRRSSGMKGHGLRELMRLATASS
jgi:hypothetical protein